MELQHLLLTYPTGPVGSHEEAKKKLYRRMYGILWVCFCTFGSITVTPTVVMQFGSQMKLGKPSVAGQQPTYVYPPDIVSVVRARFPQGTCIKARVNPTGPVVKYTIRLLSNYYFYNHSKCTGICCNLQRFASSKMAKNQK